MFLSFKILKSAEYYIHKINANAPFPIESAIWQEVKLL